MLCTEINNSGYFSLIHSVGDIDESETIISETVIKPRRTYAQAVKDGSHKKVSFKESTNVQE